MLCRSLYQSKKGTLLSNKWWLERRKEELSVSYYVNCQSAITEIAASIGGYKLRELNPTIIQRFYDDLDRRERIIITGAVHHISGAVTRMII